MSQEAIHADTMEMGLVARERVLDPVQLIMSMVLVGATAGAGQLASVLRDYSRNTKRDVVRRVGNLRFGLY